MFLYVLPHFLYTDYTADHFLKDTRIFNADDFTIGAYEKTKMPFHLCPNDDLQKRFISFQKNTPGQSFFKYLRIESGL